MEKREQQVHSHKTPPQVCISNRRSCSRGDDHQVGTLPLVVLSDSASQNQMVVKDHKVLSAYFMYVGADRDLQVKVDGMLDLRQVFLVPEKVLPAPLQLKATACKDATGTPGVRIASIQPIATIGKVREGDAHCVNLWHQSA